MRKERERHDNGSRWLFMSFIDIDAIRKRIDSDPSYKAMYEAMAAEAVEFHDTFEDDPAKMSRWGHHYFCKDDGSALIYDPKKPHDHICPLCGTNYQGELFDGVWVYQYRNQAILALMKSAVVYAVSKEEKYLKIYKEILGFYMDNYIRFKLHNKEGLEFDTYEEMKWGCGRILPQGLNESIIINRILLSAEILRSELDQKFMDKLTLKFLPEVYKMLKPQVILIHNISCWANSCIGTMGLFSGNQEMIDFAFEGELNNRRQLREGVTEDNFWHEGSIHYNFFTLEGLTMLAMFAKHYDYDFGPELTIIEDMLLAAYDYAFENHRFPNPNDGWPNVNLKTYSFIYSVGTKVFGYDSKVAKVLSSILTGKEERCILPLSKPYYHDNELSYERFVLLPDFKAEDIADEDRAINSESQNYQHSNFALLKKNDWNLFYKYGHNNPSHAHPDKMTIEVMDGDTILAKDLSNAGYGSMICNEWHRVTAAHNTVVVDGQNHTSTEEGKLGYFESDSVRASADSVYEDVCFNRELTLADDGFSDVFEVASGEERTYDYMFHVDGKLVDIQAKGLDMSDVSLGYDSNGYQHIKDVKKISSEGDTLVLNWQIDDKKYLWTVDCSDAQVFLATSPDNPISSWRQTLIVRKNAKSAVFKQTWKREA